MSIEDQLRDMIIDRYGSLRAFTIKIDMPYSTFSTILKRGVNKSHVNNIIRICEELNISADELSKNKIVTLLPDNQATKSAKVFNNEILGVAYKVNPPRKKKTVKQNKPIKDDIKYHLEDLYQVIESGEIPYYGNDLSIAERRALVMSIKTAVKISTDGIKRHKTVNNS